MEMDEALKAGHWVEPDREMQAEFWAMAAAASDSRTAVEKTGVGRGRQDDMADVGRVRHTAAVQEGGRGRSKLHHSFAGQPAVGRCRGGVCLGRREVGSLGRAGH